MATANDASFDLRLLILPALLSAAILVPCHAQDGKDRFDRITPAQAGYSSEKLDKLRAFLEKSGSQSMLLLHEGKVFFEWGDIRKKIQVHSIRKALLSSLYGIYVERGNIDLDKSLAQLGIDDSPQQLRVQERSAHVRDLLKSRSGVYLPAAAEAETMIAARPPRGSFAPGQHYYYNNWDFNAAGHVFEQASGMRIYDAFDKHVAAPLGMLDYRPEPAAGDGFYQYETERSRFPAYHFRMSAHDLALYGQLMLNRGAWKGRQLVPAHWIDTSTQPYSMTEPQDGLGYGMLWSVVKSDSPGMPAFYHTGAGVHMLGVYPQQRLVMVHRVDTEQSYRFNDGDLYAVIRLMHGARLPSR